MSGLVDAIESAVSVVLETVARGKAGNAAVGNVGSGSASTTGSKTWTNAEASEVSAHDAVPK